MRGRALSLAGFLAQRAWGGLAALKLFAHAMGNVAKLPVLAVLSGGHFVADVTLGLSEVGPGDAGSTPILHTGARAMNFVRAPAPWRS